MQKRECVFIYLASIYISVRVWESVLGDDGELHGTRVIYSLNEKVNERMDAVHTLMYI